MIKRFFGTLIALSTATIYSDQTSSIKPHQFYFGPEFANVSVSTSIDDIHIKGSKNFAGLRIGYEFTKPWAFYAGIDYLSMISSRHFKASQEGLHIHSSHQDTIYGNLDLRFGYTIFPNQFFISPYLGLGLYALGSVPNNRGFHEEWAYWSIGLRSQFPINEAFQLGFNFKLFQSFFFSKQFKNHNINVSSHSFPWGFDMGLPMTWKFNPSGTWTFQLEPYWTKMNFKEKQNVFGSKFLIGFHF